MFKLQCGDLVCDLDKEPVPSINMGKVLEVLPDDMVRVAWKNGTTSERPIGRLGKIGPPKSSYEMPPGERKKMWDEILQMSDEEIDAEIEQLDRKFNLN
jgi:hypothetical protein